MNRPLIKCQCEICHKWFNTKARHRKYCISCIPEVNRVAALAHYHKNRDAVLLRRQAQKEKLRVAWKKAADGYRERMKKPPPKTEALAFVQMTRMPAEQILRNWDKFFI